MAAMPLSRSREGRHRGADVLQQQRTASLQSREDRPPRRGEQLALVLVVGAEAPRWRPRPMHAASAWSISRLRASPGASDCTSKQGTGRTVAAPMGRKSSTMLMAALSISSTSDGRLVRPSSTTARAAAAASAKSATRVALGGCAGTSRRIARVMMPSVPSLPTKSFSSGRPATSLIRLPPRRDQAAVGQHHVEAEHVVGGHAVLHAAQPAGVGGDVAADRADLVRRRVRRVPQTVARPRPPSPRR